MKTQTAAGARKGIHIFRVTFGVLIAAMLVFVAPASAGTSESWLPLFSFDGADATAGPFSIRLDGIAVQESTGSIYVLDGDKEVIDKFNSAGEAEDFTAVGASSLTPYASPAFDTNGTGLAVDNYGPNRGRIYVSTFGSDVAAFEPSGEAAWSLDAGPYINGVAAGTDGRIYVINQTENSLLERIDIYEDGAGSPTIAGALGPFEAFAQFLAVAADGIVYFSEENPGQRLFRMDGEALQRIDAPGDEPGAAGAVALDQSSAAGHLFVLTHAEEDYLQSGGFAEYDASGNKLGEGFGKDAISAAVGSRIAYDAIRKRVYVAADGKVTAFHEVSVTTPDVTLEPVTLTGPKAARFEGTVNPLGVNNDFRFEWKKAGQSWTEAQSSPVQVLPADSATHEVSYEVTGLAKSAYNVRLVAQNTDLNAKAVSQERTFGTVPVTVTTIAAAPRTDSSARLNAMIRPGGNAAMVDFEYSDDGGSTWKAAGNTEVPEGATGAVVASAELAGLQPATAYRYRSLAETQVGPASPQGGETSFTTRSSAEMNPPPRGIELVNNPDKGNQNVRGPGGNEEFIPMSPDGERALWTVNGGAPGGNTGTGDLFLAQRTPTGWESRTLIPQAHEQVAGGSGRYILRALASDFSRFVFSVIEGPEVGPTFLRLDSAQHQEVLQRLEFPLSGGEVDVDVSEDGSHVVLVNRNTHQLEDIGDGTHEILSLMPDGLASSCGLEEGGAGFPGRLWQSGYHAIDSTDASRVYFTARPNGECAKPPGLYVRNREAGTTSLVDPGTAGSLAFIRSSRDGRQAVFRTQSKLDPADTNNTADVYRWDEQGGKSICMTCLVPFATVSAVLVSDDLSHIYFESTRQLVAGEGKAGDSNLYVLADGAVNFVADFGAPPAPSTIGVNDEPILSEDGSVLLVRAFANPGLTSDPMAQRCAGRLGASAPCEELYRYDAAIHTLECLSCSSETTRYSVGAPRDIRRGDFKMSADGSIVAFATKEALVGRDVNRDTDIYVWRKGALRLITDGISDFQEGLAAPQVRAVSANGRDLLFSIVDPGLTGFEHDGLANLYDARIGGGFEPPSAPAHCSEESCQGPLQTPPPVGRIGSGSVSRGNLSSSGRGRQCNGHKVRRGRRCVKPRRRNRRHCTRPPAHRRPPCARRNDAAGPSQGSRRERITTADRGGEK